MIERPLWLVIPCYNESDRFAPGEFAAALSVDEGLHFCFVDDGSRDATLGVLEAFRADHPGRVEVQKLDVNSGKGEAVRRGMLHVLDCTNARIVGYWDADLATPLDQLAEFEREAGAFLQWTALLGCRHKRMGTDIRRTEFRHYVGRAFATLASPLLALPVYDTQCGAKLLRREVAERVFDVPFCSRWCFDVEILARMLAAYGTDALLEGVVEVPLKKWAEVGQSRLRPLDLPRMVIDLFRIGRKYGLPGRFPPPAE